MNTQDMQSVYVLSKGLPGDYSLPILVSDQRDALTEHLDYILEHHLEEGYTWVTNQYELFFDTFEGAGSQDIYTLVANGYKPSGEPVTVHVARYVIEIVDFEGSR